MSGPRHDASLRVREASLAVHVNSLPRCDARQARADGSVVHSAVSLVISDDRRLRANDGPLRADERQLRTGNGPLRADERRRRADERRRRARERQLRTGDGQLRADECQLRAGNGQHRADERRLRGGDGQLRAHERQRRPGDGQVRASEGQLRAHERQRRPGDGQVRASEGQLRADDGLLRTGERPLRFDGTAPTRGGPTRVAGLAAVRLAPHIAVMTTRRQFVSSAALAAVGLSLPTPAVGTITEDSLRREKPPRGFLDLLRPPDSILVQTATGNYQLPGGVNGGWRDRGISVATLLRSDALHITLAAPPLAVKRVHLRWHGDMSATSRILGDAWERGYGDLEWRAWVPDRVMPWYVATRVGRATHTYGVRTGANAFCFWHVDPQGVSLWADVRSGASGVQLGNRVLDVCDVVCRAGREGETAFAAIHAFCRQMCANPRLPARPVYGSNDWYWAYGRNSAHTALVDANHIVELSPAGGNRPFAVIDDGWQPERGDDKQGIGTWDRGNGKFPDMPGLAGEIRKAGARAGIWIRPLLAMKDAPDGWRLARDQSVLDPTVPEVRQKIGDDIARLRRWGYELVKHDYTTYDIFGRWGFEMGAEMTTGTWTFASGPVRTTAEVVNELYATIRAAAGESLVIGCNTVSHLSAGHFEICRVGDDTSGTDWSRTRRMGVNTLAFRGAQHNTFYVADADCVGVTNAIPWSLNKQWLDLLARSGTMLFVSLAPDALGAEQRRDLTEALALAAEPRPLAEPLDWEGAVYPTRWRSMGSERSYNWVGEDGVGPP